MNTAMQIAQLSYDNRLPPEPVDNGAAKAEWVANGVEQLLLGADVKWRRRFERPRRVTADQFADKVQQHLVQRQIDGEDRDDGFARIVISVARGCATKSHAEYLLGYSAHPYGMLGEIAEALLEPFAEDAMIAKAEDDEL